MRIFIIRILFLILIFIAPGLALADPASNGGAPISSPAANTSVNADETSAGVGSYPKGLTFFNSKNYQAALPLLIRATQESPGNAKAFYYLGYCFYDLRDLKNADFNFYLAARKSLDPNLLKFADELKAKLPPAEQQWVENQLEAYSQAQITPSPTPSPTPLPNSGDHWGLRSGTSLVFINLADFKTDLTQVQSNVVGYQNANPSYNYQLKSSIAPAILNLELNPYYALGPDFELGAGIAFGISDGYEFAITNFDPSYYVKASFTVHSLKADFQPRFYFLKWAKGNCRLFVVPGFGIQKVYVDFYDQFQKTTSGTDNLGAEVSSLAFCADIKVGLNLNLSNDCLFSISGGYQNAMASGFQGTFYDQGYSPRNNVNGSFTMYTSPSSGKSYLLFVPSSDSDLSAFNENTSTRNNVRPMAIDLSGFQASMDLSYNF